MARITPLAAPHFPRGVYESDPHSPPTPPPGATAREIRDGTGRIIAYAWVIPEHSDRSFDAAMWEYLDFRDAIDARHGLRLVRDAG